ncbi:ATP-binding protein [Klugiella xanthotipulae]|uniref:Phage shock protein C (PspC) family protein n=2 Tax=Klugiella xanthotipulae TaxID=244735 RepID=A0A543HY63_9MICO|nr:phage shock protein C (PspC) family protein [Klugiella xanthotipulae]
MVRPRLRVIGGVCTGLAQHTGWSVSLIRTLMLASAAAGGAGFVFYAWLWVTTPSGDGTLAGIPKSASEVLQRPSGNEEDALKGPGVRRLPLTEILLGLALLVIGLALVARQLGVEVPLSLIIPLVVICAGVGLAWRQFDGIRRASHSSGSSALVRILGAVVLVALGILLFFVMGDRPNVWTVIVAALSVLLGVAVVVAPWLARLNRDLSEERAARARDLERAEIAAHLHDSVLQTLALIQQKSDAQSDIARIARAQERELRDWLFGEADVTPDRDLAEQVRAAAAEIEADFPARFDLVVIGTPPTAGFEVFGAAAREAMLNAARHAGGTISVFLECGAGSWELSVVDRGPGFTLEEVPDDRHGVRESIVARMERAGGDARVSRGPGGVGTEVRVRLPLVASESTGEK